jgi:hypothetical protein
MTDIMVDLETLGTDSNAVIVSISAVQFDMNTGEVGKQFEIGVDLKEQIAKGAIIDVDTVMWWLEQSKDAQQQLTSLKREPVNVVLNAFNHFIHKNKINNMWGNGATFDNVIIRNLYKRHDYAFQLPFWVDRCVRTYVDTNDIDTRDFKFVGIKHRGIDDCLHQIKYCTGDL